MDRAKVFGLLEEIKEMIDDEVAELEYYSLSLTLALTLSLLLTLTLTLTLSLIKL